MWSRYLIVGIGAAAVAVGAASSSSASGTRTELALTDQVDFRDEGCRAVLGASGGDRLCASSAAGKTVVGFRAQPPGLACPSGGRAIAWGADANASGVLDPSELEGNTYVCNHSVAYSRRGSARVLTTALPPRNGHCPAGGTLVQSGVDWNENGRLEPSEIDRASFACNRFGGPAVVASVEVTDEPAGPVCARGGKRIAIGHEGENPRITYACDVP